MGYNRQKNKMKKLLIILPLLFLATSIYAQVCYRVEGSIVTYKEVYDENKKFLYQEKEGSQFYSSDIYASDRESAKRKAMDECESMCYSVDPNPQEVTDSKGNVVGYYRLVRKTQITKCVQAYSGDCN